MGTRPRSPAELHALPPLWWHDAPCAGAGEGGYVAVAALVLDCSDKASNGFFPNPEAILAGQQADGGARRLCKLWRRQGREGKRLDITVN